MDNLIGKETNVDKEIERDRERLETRRMEKQDERKKLQTEQKEQGEEYLELARTEWLEDMQCYLDELDTGGTTPTAEEQKTET